MSDNFIKRVQQDLTRLGLYNRGIDGIWGSGTEAAYNVLVNSFKGNKDTSTTDSSATSILVAWGNKLEYEFIVKAKEIADMLLLPTDTGICSLLSCMAFETGESFSPSQKNLAGSSGTGLIQFMEKTANGLNTTTQELASMTAIEQLDYVYKYFLPYKGKLHNLGDLYMAILWPVGIGKDDSYTLWTSNDKAYIANRGLDKDHKGYITRKDALVQVQAKLTKGLTPPFAKLITFK